MEFGRVRVLLHAELLKRVDRRLNPGAPLVLFRDVDSVQEESGLRAGDAADDVAVHDLGTDRLRVACRRQERDTRRQARQLVKASAVERQIDDLFVGDDLAQRRRLGVEQRSFSDDLHFSREPAEIECELDSGGPVRQ